MSWYSLVHIQRVYLLELNVVAQAIFLSLLHLDRVKLPSIYNLLKRICGMNNHPNPAYNILSIFNEDIKNHLYMLVKLNVNWTLPNCVSLWRPSDFELWPLPIFVICLILFNPLWLSLKAHGVLACICLQFSTEFKLTEDGSVVGIEM